MSEEERMEIVSLTQEEIAFNRQIAVNRLRYNPAGHKQIRGCLHDRDDRYCALGEIAEAFHISPLFHSSDEIYKGVSKRIGDYADFIIAKNDYDRLSFAEIANILAKRWGLS
jgi:hypothetical protein